MAWYDRLAHTVSVFMGGPWGLLLTTLFIVACLVSSLWIGLPNALLALTTILSVATQYTGQLIQATQKRSEDAIHLKLDELIRCLPQADNNLRGIEHQGSCEEERPC